MDWVPVGVSATAVHRAPIAIEDTRVSNQQIDVTLAGNLNIGAIFGGTVAAGEVGYWLDAMAYSDQYENAPGPNGVILGNRFGYGLRVMFRVKQLSAKAKLTYNLIGASVDAGFAQAGYEIEAYGFGPQAPHALATILDGVASSGTTLTADTFYKLNSSILKNLVAYIESNEATMQPVRVATLVSNSKPGDSLDVSQAVLYAMRAISSGATLEAALKSAGDLDPTSIRLAYSSIMGDVPSNTEPSNANSAAADRWLSDN